MFTCADVFTPSSLLPSLSQLPHKNQLARIKTKVNEPTLPGYVALAGADEVIAAAKLALTNPGPQLMLTCVAALT